MYSVALMACSRFVLGGGMKASKLIINSLRSQIYISYIIKSIRELRTP